VIVALASHGGLDEFGWKPDATKPIPDIDTGQRAAEPFAGRRFAVRAASGLTRERVSDDALADALAGAESARWQDVRDALLALDLPEDLRSDLERLDGARRKKVFVDLGLYGENDRRPRGAVFVAPFGLAKEALQENEQEDAQSNATEDDAAGSMPGFRQTLAEHSAQVEEKALAFAEAAGLPDARVKDVALAGYLHDLGKSDPRFQAWLQYGDPLGPDLSNPEEFLAKSGRFLPRAAREASGLPKYWRHEALSVRLALAHARFKEAEDRELVLWLAGVHHGHGRPFFPHCDPDEKTPDVGPQSLAFNWKGLDWPSLFVRLKARYGVWELARMEAILRLADHRASEDAAEREAST
jgi:CRISPR-associated endonuclease/helicase Cas3